jgi:hypothetical protein
LAPFKLNPVGEFPPFFPNGIFTWESGWEDHILQVDNDEGDFSVPVIQVFVTTTSTPRRFDPPDDLLIDKLVAGELYVWRVKALDPFGNETDWSTLGDFTFTILD